MQDRFMAYALVASTHAQMETWNAISRALIEIQLEKL